MSCGCLNSSLQQLNLVSVPSGNRRVTVLKNHNEFINLYIKKLALIISLENKIVSTRKIMHFSGTRGKPFSYILLLATGEGEASFGLSGFESFTFRVLSWGLEVLYGDPGRTAEIFFFQNIFFQTGILFNCLSSNHTKKFSDFGHITLTYKTLLYGLPQSSVSVMYWRDLRVHTEWQRPLSGVHSIMMEK